MVLSSPVPEDRPRGLKSGLGFQVKTVQSEDTALRGVEGVGMFLVEFAAQFIGLGWGAYQHLIKLFQAITQQPMDDDFLFLFTI